jgi:hypothetical protein
MGMGDHLPTRAQRRVGQVHRRLASVAAPSRRDVSSSAR